VTKDASSPRAVIADDHAIVRQGLRRLLEGRFEMHVVAEAENGLETIAAAKVHRPDLLMLDIAMPLARGVEVLGEVRRWSPQTKVVAFTGLASRGLVRDLVAAGANGVLLKSGPPAELESGIAAVMAGQRAYSPTIREALEAGDAPELTVRERQILSLIARGQSNTEIAEILRISPKTVDNHRTHVMQKLGVHSVAELIAHALREGLLDPSRHA
jgi:DNA-binding NarL/FixJ family response regulator